MRMTTETDSKEKLLDTMDPVEMPDADIEEGECLSDDDEEPDVKVTDKSPEADKEEEEEDDIGGMITFQGNIFDEEILIESTNEVVVPTDVIKLIKDNLQDIDIKDKVDNSIVINNCLVNLAMKIDFSDEISYDFESLVFFVKNMTQPHPVYIKKVSNIDQVIALVHMDHRKVLIDAFTSEKVERFKDLPFLSNEAKMRRLYKQFKSFHLELKQFLVLCHKPSTMSSSPCSTSISWPYI